MGWLNKYAEGGIIQPNGWVDKYGDTLPKAQKGKSFEDITGVKPITSLNNYSTDAGIMNKIKRDANAREIERRIHNVAKETVIGQGKKSTPYSEKLRVLKNKASIIGQPNVQIDEQGNTSRINQNRGYEGNAENFMSQREDKAGGHAIGALEAASIVMPAGQLVEKGLKVAGKYLTEQTALKNAYKLNPYAFKPNPEMMYRGIGKEGMEDALESGVFRAKQNVEPSMYNGVDMSKQFNGTYYTPKFETASQYGKGFIAEVPKDATSFRLRYKGKGNKTWSQIADENIPINKGRILEKHWLKRYKEVPTNKPGDVWWNGKGYKSTPTSSQEVISRSSGMDALPEGYNIHLKNQSPYVPPTTDPKLMTTQGRMDWNGVNYDNIQNWFKTRPTKTINTSNSNDVFNIVQSNSTVNNVSSNVSNTGIDIPNSLKNIEQGIINKSKSVSSIDNVENSYPSYNTDIDYSKALKPKKSLISKLVGTAMSPAVLANNEFTRQLIDAIRKTEPEDVNTKNIRDNFLKIFPGFKEKTLISPKEQGSTINSGWLNKY